MALILELEMPTIVERSLFTPTLQEIKNVVTPALSENFSEVTVDIVDCPDLTKEPFNLAASGLDGSKKIFEIGGPSFLLPLVQRNKIYDIKMLLNKLNYHDNDKNAFVIGAGAGPWPKFNRNCEMMMNIFMTPNDMKNETRIAWVGENNKCILENNMNNDTRFALLANLYLSEGKPGKVMKVYAKKRTGNLDFIATMQRALSTHYKDKLVGLGGTFLLKQGKAKQHVMPDFSATPLTTEKSLDNWLNYYDMSAPLIAVGTFVSGETDLDLRVQHFHSFSNHGEGGHYHIDTTPDIVEWFFYNKFWSC
ncbi:ester hydrolase C11orf54 homolog isoform X2 [Aphidius gifuensis]|uniref:ester hydrolase C11orf54 homolog isoform X2 n=1 Tax=Aphidius gifuensis TaxID=684658 RepID=UPI001CDBF583|nr:ester hydrolase C11orf54 homolog isoform X2 [Aphidius gifuensis]